MRLSQMLNVIDSHTAGEPARIVVGGIPVLKGKTVAEKKQYLIDHKDNLRKSIEQVVNSPKNRCTKEDILKSFGWNQEEIDLYNEADKTEHYIKQDLLNLNKKTISMITGRYGGTTPYQKGE